MMQASETYVDVSNWLSIHKNLDLDTLDSIKRPKTIFHHVRMWLMGQKWAWSIGCGPERVLQVSEAYVDVSNWLPINKNLDLATQHSIKLPKTTFHYVRTWPIMRKNGRGRTGNFPVDNLRAPGEIRLFRPSRGLKKIFRLLLKFADNEPILCITDQTK